MLKDNPEYQLSSEFGKYRFYTPANLMSYHISRYIQVTNQQIYNNAGATKEVLEQVMTGIIDRCNNQKDITTLRTDIASIANSIKYRLKYPVDELCSIRTGAMLCFLEYDTEDGTVVSEDPNKYEDFWTKKKMDLATNSPDIYSFFLTMGISSTPAYKERYDTLTGTDYFIQRTETIQSLLPATGQ